MQQDKGLVNLPEPSLLHRIMVMIAIPAVVVALYMAFIWSPIERQMGVVQKIFYFHVGSAWNAFLAFAVVAVFALLYLITKKRIYDVIAGVSAEIGVVFTAIVLTTGPIWGRSAWNVWWNWEPRLTTTVILFFIYVAYITVRSLDMEWQKRARLSGVLGIIGALNVPIVYMSVRWWESTLHPVVMGEGVEEVGGGMEPEMLITLITCVFTMTLVYAILMQKGIYVEKLRLHVAKLKAKQQEKMIS